MPKLGMTNADKRLGDTDTDIDPYSPDPVDDSLDG
jgi:hypothetical protein